MCSWRRRKAGGSRAPEGDQRDDRIEISASSPSSSPRHQALSMCNLTCSADWLPAAAAALPPVAVALVLWLALSWAVTSLKRWQRERRQEALQGSKYFQEQEKEQRKSEREGRGLAETRWNPVPRQDHYQKRVGGARRRELPVCPQTGSGVV